jgi:undecaprenyl-diphosphatase
MKTFTFLGSTAWLVVVVAALALILWRQRQGRSALMLIAGAAGGDVLMEILKVVFRRPRPQPFFGIPAPHSWSFPSGHALNSFCVYLLAAALIYRHARSTPGRIACWTAAAIMAVMPGISRIYLGVHYPSDVLAGYVAATALLCGLLAAVRETTPR